MGEAEVGSAEGATGSKSKSRDIARSVYWILIGILARVASFLNLKRCTEFQSGQGATLYNLYTSKSLLQLLGFLFISQISLPARQVSSFDNAYPAWSAQETSDIDISVQMKW